MVDYKFLSVCWKIALLLAVAGNSQQAAESRPFYFLYNVDGKIIIYLGDSNQSCAAQVAKSPSCASNECAVVIASQRHNIAMGVIS